MAHFDVWTVREMIDAAFGEKDNNCPVDLNMVGSVLFILARRMDLLKRHFKIEMQEKMPNKMLSKSTFTVSEIKIHAKGKSVKRKHKLLKDELEHKIDYSTTGSAAHKRSGDKYLENKQPHKIYHVNIYESLLHERHGGKSDNRSSAIRQRSDMEKSPARSLQKAKKHFGEVASRHQRKSEKYSDKMSPPGRRKARKYKRSSCHRNKAADNYPHSDETSDETSDESALSSKSRTGKCIDQQGKTDAEERPLSYAGRLKMQERHDRKIKYDDYQASSDDDDLEAHHEKIYIVSRTTTSGIRIKVPAVRLNPVVTQEQFKHLVRKIRQLQKKLGISTNWDDLRKVTFMTHPKAALNISMRLDKAESRLAHVLEIVTQFASQVPEIDLQAIFNETSLRETRTFQLGDFDTDNGSQLSFGSVATVEPGPVNSALKPPSIKPEDNVTRGEFNDELQRLEHDVERMLHQAIGNARLETAWNRTLGRNERQVNGVQRHFQNFAGFNYNVENIGKRVESIDQRMSSQLAAFQDILLHMQGELETALEKLSDSILSPKEDPAAVAQILDAFMGYKSDLAETDAIQIDLKQAIENSNNNLEDIAKIIDELRNRKCTRELMFESLDDKLTLKDINGVLTQGQFCAVSSKNGHLLQELNLKIFSYEHIWQLTIDNFITKCDACADITQMKFLQENIQRYFNEMDNDLDDMFSITIRPKEYPTDKVVERDEKCLSCGAPAEATNNELNMNLWQEIKASPDSDIIPVKLKYEAISGTCIPLRPIPHPLGQDSFICQHDCGEIDNTKKEILELFVKKLNPDSHSIFKDKLPIFRHRCMHHFQRITNVAARFSCDLPKHQHTIINMSSFGNN